MTRFNFSKSTTKVALTLKCTSTWNISTTNSNASNLYRVVKIARRVPWPCDSLALGQLPIRSSSQLPSIYANKSASFMTIPVVNSLPICQSHHARGCELLALFHHNSQLSGNIKLGILALTSDSNIRWTLDLELICTFNFPITNSIQFSPQFNTLREWSYIMYIVHLVKSTLQLLASPYPLH